jgi:phosphoglucomutase
MALKSFGFDGLSTVASQDIVDGNFPTVKSPNPENADALNLAIEQAKAIDAELVLATDPDADRVGIAVKDDKGEWVLLNGNQTAALLLYYLFTKWSENGKLDGNQYMVKTIVTTELLIEIANKYKIENYDVLTGFKFIAEIIRQNEGKKTFIGGGEESYGYLAGEFVRDKDAIMACALIAETAAWAKDQGKTMYELLLDIYVEFGYYKEKLVNVEKHGKEGAEAIKQMMSDYRQNPPKTLAGSAVVTIKDYELQESTDCATGTKSPIALPKSDVLQFFTADGSKISVRPSGTEPKIKFYFSVKGQLPSVSQFEATQATVEANITKMVNDLGL